MNNVVEKQKFLQAVVNAIKMISDVPINVRVAEVERNNGKYDCIQVTYGQDTYSNIGVDTYYQMFCDGDFSAVTNAAEAVIQAQKSPKAQMDGIRDIAQKVKDYEWAKRILRCRLVNTALNRDTLSDMPHIPFHDLSIIFSLVLYSDEEQCFANVNNNLFAGWNIGITELFRDALANMQAEAPAEIKDMFQVIEDLEKTTVEGTRVKCNGIEAPVLYVLTNKDAYMGAAVILYPGVLESCAEKLGGDFYLLPSTVHEFILAPVYGAEPDGYRSIIQNINQTVVRPEDVLSDHAYLYSAAKKQITMV